MILVIARIKSFRTWVINVKLAYLQSNKPLIRKIFVTNPAPEFDVFSKEFLELLGPIYSLADSGDEWHLTQNDRVQIDLKMTPTIIDQSLSCQFEDDQLVAIN